MDLTKLTEKEILDLMWEIHNEAYQKSKPYRDELSKRYQEEKE